MFIVLLHISWTIHNFNDCLCPMLLISRTDCDPWDWYHQLIITRVKIGLLPLSPDQFLISVVTTAFCVFLLVFKHWEWIKTKLLCPGASSHAACAGWLRPPDAWCCLPARKIAGSAWSGLGLHTWLLLLRTRLVSESQSVEFLSWSK